MFFLFQSLTHIYKMPGLLFVEKGSGHLRGSPCSLSAGMRATTAAVRAAVGRMGLSWPETQMETPVSTCS